MTFFIAASALPSSRASRHRTSHRLLPTARSALALVAALGCGLAVAQPVPAQLPSGAEPGRELPRPVMPQSSTAVPQITVPQGSAAEVPPGARDLRFTLKDLRIEGATAFPPESLQPLYAGLIGREVSVAEVFEAANAIELRYRNAGYVTSRVVVPQQTIEDGRFRVVVVEGFVSEIVYQADIGPAREAVERLLNGVRDMKPVNVAEIERRLLLANDLPGLTVRGALEPSATQRGGSVMVVRVERKATEGSVTIDNRVSPYLGSGQVTGTYAWNSIGARADRVTLTARSSLPLDRSAALAAGYDALVADNGTIASLYASHARSKPRRELTPLEVESQVSTALGTVTVPLLRSREENLRGFGQFEVRNVDTDIVGTAYTRDRLRIVRAGMSYDLSDRFDGITTVRGQVHQGLSALGASPDGSALASRANGRSDFTKLTVDLTRLQQFTPRLSLVGSLTSQFSRRPLLASEEIGLGGPSFGRGFDEGEVSTDNGIAATLELRYLPAGLPVNAQVYGFVDGARGWAADGGNVPAHSKLASFGGGVRSKLNETLFATVEIAKPINHDVRTEGNRHARAFVSLSAQF